MKNDNPISIIYIFMVIPELNIKVKIVMLKIMVIMIDIFGDEPSPYRPQSILICVSQITN